MTTKMIFELIYVFPYKFLLAWDRKSGNVASERWFQELSKPLIFFENWLNFCWDIRLGRWFHTYGQGRRLIWHRLSSLIKNSLAQPHDSFFPRQWVRGTAYPLSLPPAFTLISLHHSAPKSPKVRGHTISGLFFDFLYFNFWFCLDSNFWAIV